MSDIYSERKRSEVMSRISGQDTALEGMVRRGLFAKGFRYRKNLRSLPGKPDIVLAKYRAIIFVHGCFWHGHHGCKRSTIPTTRTDFWRAKIGRTMERDKEKTEALLATGWRVAVIWQCSLKGSDVTLSTVNALADWIRSDRSWIEMPPLNKHRS